MVAFFRRRYLYVAASDLIPEVNRKKRKPMVSMGVFGRCALFYFLHRLNRGIIEQR